MHKMFQAKIQNSGAVVYKGRMLTKKTELSNFKTLGEFRFRSLRMFFLEGGGAVSVHCGHAKPYI